MNDDTRDLFERIQRDHARRMKRKLGPYAGLRAAEALERMLDDGPRGQFFVIPDHEWERFCAIVEHLAVNRDVVQIEASQMDLVNMEEALQQGDDQGHILIIDARQGITEGALQAVTRYFGQIEHTWVDFNEDFGIVFAMTEDVFLEMSATEREALLRNSCYRGYYPGGLDQEGPLKEFLDKPAGPGAGRGYARPGREDRPVRKPRIATIYRQPTDPTALADQEERAVATWGYDRSFWLKLLNDAKRSASVSARHIMSSLSVPADVADLLNQQGGGPLHLAQRLTQELHGLLESLVNLSYTDQQVVTALDRSYRLINERVRVELTSTARWSDEPARSACALVFGCDPEELHLLEFEDDRYVVSRAMFPASALAECAGMRKQLEIIQLRHPSARVHNVFQLCNQFDLLFSASEAATLWSFYAIPYQITYWSEQHRIYDWRKVRIFGLP